MNYISIESYKKNLDLQQVTYFVISDQQNWIFGGVEQLFSFR